MKELAIVIGVFLIIFVPIVTVIKVQEAFATVETNDFKIVCLDNVEYWYKKAGHTRLLAVKYNAETGEIVTCE